MKKEISIIQMARELGITRQHVYKILDQLEIEKTLRANTSPRGPMIAYITTEAYQRVKEHVLGESTQSSEIAIEMRMDPNYGGIFYLIQLEPEFDAERFTLGFSSNLEKELHAYKAIAPYATVVQTWPCKLLWEETAIDCTAQDCEMIYTDVFRADSIDTVKSRCEQFFALLPEIDDTGTSET